MKTLTVFVFLLISGVCAAAEPPDAYVTRVIYAPVSIVIDGDLSDWEGIEVPEEPLLQICIGNGCTPSSGDADLSASFRCFIHEDTFYIAVSVTDDTLVFGQETFSTYKDDSVEIYFDGDLAVRRMENGSESDQKKKSVDTNYDRNDAQIRLSKDSRGVVHVGGVGLFGDRLMILPGLWESLGLVGAIRENAQGYSAELKVPKGVFVATPLQFGATVGFNVMVNDDDDGGDRDSKISWSPDPQDQGWLTAEVFGELVIQPREQP